MTQPDPITGFVARILNSRELVINRGAEHGVELDMYFEVLAPEGENIEDPLTGESLGSVARPKVAVKIVQVEAELAVARTFRSRRRNVGGTSAIRMFDQMFAPPNTSRNTTR